MFSDVRQNKMLNYSSEDFKFSAFCDNVVSKGLSRLGKETDPSFSTLQKGERGRGRKRESERINVNLKECAKNSKSFVRVCLFVCLQKGEKYFV